MQYALHGAGSCKRYDTNKWNETESMSKNILFLFLNESDSDDNDDKSERM